MPRIRVVESYSHMFGEAILERHHRGLQEEVVCILTTTELQPATKASLEKTKQGRIVWSGRDFNVRLGHAFRDRGWSKRKLFFPQQTRYFIDVDFCKDEVAVEIQFGKYAFVQHDFSKFRYLFEIRDENRVDVGIEVIPSASLQRRMYTGPANFESVVASLQAHARNDPPVPLWLLSIDAD